MLRRLSALGMFAINLMVMTNAPCQVKVPNGSFEEGERWPTGWRMIREGIVAWEKTGHSDTRCVSLTGDGMESDSGWRSDDFQLESNKLYRLSVWIKAPVGQSPSINFGFSDTFRSYGLSKEWKQYHCLLQSPGNPSVHIRFWTWSRRSKVFVDDITIVEVKPVHFTQGEIELGEGEVIKGSVYQAKGTSSLATGIGGPGSRYLFRGEDGQFKCVNWYVHSQGVVFRHNVGGIEQTEASFKFRLGWLPAGKVVVLASNDGKNFEQLCELKKIGWTDVITLPAKLFPAKDTYIWFRCIEDPGHPGPPTFELLGYEYKAKLAKQVPDLEGKTEFIEVTK